MRWSMVRWPHAHGISAASRRRRAQHSLVHLWPITNISSGRHPFAHDKPTIKTPAREKSRACAPEPLGPAPAGAAARASRLTQGHAGAPAVVTPPASQLTRDRIERRLSNITHLRHPDAPATMPRAAPTRPAWQGWPLRLPSGARGERVPLRRRPVHQAPPGRQAPKTL